MTKSLFDNFDHISAKQWKQKIQVDLKGADYNEALIYKSLEGIDVKPFYNQEDISEINTTNLHPSSWKNSLKIEVSDAIQGNQLALQGIKKGAESIFFIIQNEDTSPKDLLQLITPDTTIFITTLFLSIAYTQKIDTIAKANQLEVFMLTDIIGNLAKSGNWYHNLKEDHTILEKSLQETTHLKSTISIDTCLYQNAGATMVQQLAYSLAHANEYLNHFENIEESIFQNTQIVFKVAIGGNYFFEIAKLRALRLLWDTLAAEYKSLKKCHILAHPTLRNKTIMDYNVNMLRTTTECMSAILGGADTIYNIPYDDIYNLENDFGTRISLNQLLILKNESYFDQVENGAAGSYYIESLTEQLAKRALSLFKDIENTGGFLNQLKSGTIQKKIKESAQKEQKLFDTKEIILTGSNKYQNLDEVTPNFEKSVFPNKKERKTLLEPVIKRRLTHLMEKKTQ